MDHPAYSGELNVLGGPLEPCGTDPMTGFFRDGCCSTGPEDAGSHTICAVVTAEFLDEAGGVVATGTAESGALKKGDRKNVEIKVTGAKIYAYRYKAIK
jgi:uncharacterized protein (DUF2237 family)